MSIIGSAKNRISNIGSSSKDANPSGDTTKPDTTLPYNTDVKKGPVITPGKTRQISFSKPDDDKKKKKNEEKSNHSTKSSTKSSSESTGSTKSERRRRLSQDIAKKIDVKSGMPIDKQVDGAVRELRDEQVEDFTDEPSDVFGGAQKGDKTAKKNFRKPAKNDKYQSERDAVESGTKHKDVAPDHVSDDGTARHGETQPSNQNQTQPGLLQKGVDKAKGVLGYGQNHDIEEMQGPEVKHPHKIEEDLGMAASPEGRGDLKKQAFIKSEKADPKTRGEFSKPTTEQAGTQEAAKANKSSVAQNSKPSNDEKFHDAKETQETNQLPQKANNGAQQAAGKTHEASKTAQESAEKTGGSEHSANVPAGTFGNLANHAKDIGTDAAKFKDGHIPTANDAKDVATHGKNVGKDITSQRKNVRKGMNSAKNKLMGKGSSGASKSAGEGVADDAKNAQSKTSEGTKVKDFANQGENKMEKQGKQTASHEGENAENKASNLGDKSGMRNGTKSGEKTLNNGNQEASEVGNKSGEKAANKGSTSNGGVIIDDGKQLSSDAKGLQDGKMPDSQQAKDMADHGKKFGNDVNDAKNNWAENNQSSGGNNAGMKAEAGAAAGAAGAAGGTAGGVEDHRNKSQSKGKDAVTDDQKEGSSAKDSAGQPKKNFFQNVVGNAKDALHMSK